MKNHKKHLIEALAFFTLANLAAASNSPNDSYFSQQWALSNHGGLDQIVVIDSDNFHTIEQQGVAGADIGWMDARDQVAKLATNPVTIAVIDSGLDLTHTDLLGRVAPGAWDFLKNFPFVTDPYGHGTHVTGIIAANTDNGIGIAGIAPPSVKVLPLRTIWAANDPKNNGFSYVDPLKTTNPKAPVYTLVSDFAAQAVNYAVSHGARVINYSGTWPKIIDTENARTAFRNAVKAGVLIVVAAGNDRKDEPTYPCGYEGVLCVGAITNTGKLATYSNFGGVVDLLAPGDGILSTYSTKVESEILRINGYELMSGTSQSAPQVSGVAGTLASVFPNIGLNELKARLLISAAPLPSKESSLYGVVNLKRALDASAQPVYLPDFKSLDAFAVDESTLSVSNKISVQNLWLAANQLKIEVTANGKPAGTIQAANLASGDSISVPWTYTFASLEESSEIHLNLRITDQTGTSKDFGYNARAVRIAQSLKTTQTENIAGIKSSLPSCGNTQVSDWICVNNGHLFSNRLNNVVSVPKEAGPPRFFKEVAYDDNGSTLQIYDPSNRASPISTVNIPGMQGIREVVRLDVKGNGQMDWVIIGVGGNPGDKGTHYGFYFLDPSLKPLFGSAPSSNYQIYVTYNLKTGDAYVGNLRISQSYGGAGSWIRVNGNLLPAIMASGSLPTKDNFPEQNARRYKTTTHLYYFSPLPATVNPPLNVAQTPVFMEVRALDDAKFRTRYPNAHLENIIPENDADQKAGRLRILIGNGNDLAAQTLIWDIRSVTDQSVNLAVGWDQLAATANPSQTWTPNSSQNSSAFVSFYDSQGERGGISWVDSNGQYINQTEFSFMSSENPLAGLIGTFHIPKLGYFWFLQSGFDLVGYRADSAGAARSDIILKTTPLERDSSFQISQFSQMFSPVMVGTATNPLPGVYLDSTLVRGNQVSVAVWNPVTNEIEKPLRYSLQIPERCMQMNPVQLTSEAESFSLPLFCVQLDGQVQLLMIVP